MCVRIAGLMCNENVLCTACVVMEIYGDHNYCGINIHVYASNLYSPSLSYPAWGRVHQHCRRCAVGNGRHVHAILRHIHARSPNSTHTAFQKCGEQEEFITEVFRLF